MMALFTKTNLQRPFKFLSLRKGGSDNFPDEMESHESFHLILFHQCKLYQGKL